MTGDTTGAAVLYREAASLTNDQVEQRYLLGQAHRHQHERQVGH
ncbi:hypothetical protein [Micromonospora sp. KC606]|nr:hypothetical protein [Micromonospora sp. KC606]